MKCRFTFTTAYRFSAPVSGHVFHIRAFPSDTPGQRVLQTHLTTSLPQPPASFFDSVCGNLTLTGRMDEPHDELFFESSGIVRTCLDDNRSDYPAAPYFVYPTRLTTPGPSIVNLWERVKTTLTGDVQADALLLMHAAHASLVYMPGVTNVGTTAEQALSCGKGVCQDYSHVLLSLLRLASIPSLYVAGLMAGEGATHAWVQAWVNNRWMALDPTHDCLAQGAYIALARGCDFEDAALERGIFLGSARQSVQSSAVVEVVE